MTIVYLLNYDGLYWHANYGWVEWDLHGDAFWDCFLTVNVNLKPNNISWLQSGKCGRLPGRCSVNVLRWLKFGNWRVSSSVHTLFKVGLAIQVLVL